MRTTFHGSLVVLRPESSFSAPLSLEAIATYDVFAELRDRPRHIILDLTDVRKIDIVGKEELLKLLRDFRPMNRRIVIIGAAHYESTPYTLGFLLRNFTVRDTLEEALQEFLQDPMKTTEQH